MTEVRLVFRRRLAACCLVVLLLGGCNRDAANEPGVVALVNGDPIRAADLEARHDLRHLGVPKVDNPTVDRLRDEYGTVLADMIVARLVRQELSRLHRSVTAAEKAQAEQEVLADYPDGTFDRMLVEEHIDRDRWREMLADRLALEKFTREVLSQDVRVSVSEAANYYKDHIDAFTTPARVRLELVTGREAEAVKAALAAYRKAGQLSSLDGLTGIMAREISLPVNNLPTAWREAVKPLKSGEASALIGAGREATVLILLERLPETVLDPAKAYARVEAVLSRDKLAKAFEAWLAEALAEARISVNSRLAVAAGPVGDKVEKTKSRTEMAAAEEEPVPPATVAVRLPKVPDDINRPAQEASSPTAPLVAPVSGSGPDTQSAPEVASPDKPADIPAAAQQEASVAVSADTIAPGPSPEAPKVQADAGKDAGEGTSASHTAPVQAAPTDGTTPVSPLRAPSPDTAPAPESPGKTDGGEVEFLAVKASWILYTVDGGREERTYIKPGKPHKIVYTQKLSVRLGSPSEVTYRFGGRETTVEVGKKESRTLEFP